MDKRIEKNLNDLLRPGERVLWHGKTKPFGILAGREGKLTRLQWILSTVCIAAIIGLVLAFGNATASVIGLLLLLLAILIAAPLLSHRSILTQEYFITNERVLLVKPNVGANAIERADVDDCRVMPVDPQGEALVIGSSLFPEGSKQLRWRSLHPKLGRYARSYDGLTVAEGLVFYNVDHADEALALLQKPA